MDSLEKILKSRKKEALTGPVSQLKLLEDALLRYIFELRKQGLIINTFIVVLRVLFLLPEFCATSFTAHCSTVKCFMVAHSFAYRMGTHTLQRMTAEIKSEALNFMLFMHHIVFVANCDWHFFINMD